MAYTKYCHNCKKFVKYNDQGICPYCNQKDTTIQIRYCPTCMKFTELNTFFDRCSICKKMYPQKYSGSYKYYLLWKDDPDFHEKEPPGIPFDSPLQRG